MIIDGKKIAEKIKDSLEEEIKGLPEKPQLDVVWVGQNPVSEKFIGIKKRIGGEIGVEVLVHHFPESISEDELIKEVEKISSSFGGAEKSGIIIQLPLPKKISSISVQKILNIIPSEKDVDLLSDEAREKFQSFDGGELEILPPVVGAVRDIFEHEGVEVRGKRAVVIGRGKLVGEPSAVWLLRQGADVEILDEDTKNISDFTKDADIIISGAGSPGLIKPEMIKEGVVLVDASTSEVHGKLSGDADPECASKCRVFTPVPGGVGPITIVELFKNLVSLSKLF